MRQARCFRLCVQVQAPMVESAVVKAHVVAEGRVDAKGHADPEGEYDGAVRAHLRLGITWRGFQAFCQQELEIQDSLFMAPGMIAMFKDVHEVRARWGYTAPGEHDAWIAEAYPDELTCYDLNAAIKKWLRANNAADKSVCEVLQARGFVDSADKKLAVGPAASFLSHTQKENPWELYMCMSHLHLGRRGLEPKLPIWVDACSLRQCANNEFRADEVVHLIKEIGFTYVSMDDEGAYSTRSFCLLETYAAVVAQQPLSVREAEDSFWCCNPLTWCCCIRMLPCYDPGFAAVDSASAQCWSPEDKVKIDEYIAKNVEGGHVTINQIMDREAVRGFRQKQLFLFNILCCFPCHCCCLIAKITCPALRPWVWDSCTSV